MAWPDSVSWQDKLGPGNGILALIKNSNEDIPGVEKILTSSLIVLCYKGRRLHVAGNTLVLNCVCKMML